MGLTYRVVLHPADEGGYVVEIPELPGCLSQEVYYCQLQAIDRVLSLLPTACQIDDHRVDRRFSLPIVFPWDVTFHQTEISV